MVQGIWTLTWWPITILALALLVVLTAIIRLTSSIAQRKPALVRQLSKPVFQTILRSSDARLRSNGSGPAISANGSEPAPDDSPDRIEPLIPEEALAVLSQRDREMLRSILRLDVSTAREVMIPRLDMVVVDMNTTPAEAVEPIIKSGHSRIPVYEGSIDHIVGIIHSRDLLETMSQPEPTVTLSDLIRPAYFIPETKRLDDLLEEFQQKAVQMAIVVDEYGGTEGLVTMEDLLEEIVGEIEDEFSRGVEREVVHLPNGSVLVSAGITTEDVEEMFGIRLNSPDVDTAGGYVYRTLGRMPQAGDVVEAGDLRIEVVSVLGRRIRKLRIDPQVREPGTPPPPTLAPDQA
ncbi:MAG: hemolysin family protein [Dehalococcoidia bacterium]